MSNDYELRPTTVWNVALDIKDKDAPSTSFAFKSTGYVDGAAPFNHSGWPVWIEASVRQVPGWGLKSNSAAQPPASPACSSPKANCGPVTKVTSSRMAAPNYAS